MRLLFIGDIVGTPGVQAVRSLVPRLRLVEQIDVVVANAENATNGSGLHPRDYRQLRAAGVDAITLGDHIYKKLEVTDLLTADEPICKPANFPQSAPGSEFVRLRLGEMSVVVVSLMGRTFMRPVDCPFVAIDRVLAKLEGERAVILVDVHAEATADKYQLFHHLKGRVTAVIGTHTHVQTADEQIQSGTAFLCDAGMTGPFDSILGRRIDRVLATTIDFVPTMFDVATGDVRLSGVIVDVDPKSARATGVTRVMRPLPTTA